MRASFFVGLAPGPLQHPRIARPVPDCNGKDDGIDAALLKPREIDARVLRRRDNGAFGCRGQRHVGTAVEHENAHVDRGSVVGASGTRDGR